MVANVWELCLSRDVMGSHAKEPTNQINIATLAGHRMKFIEMFIPKAQNLEVYSISDLPCAQAYSHFLEVQSKFLSYKSRNLCQGFIWRFMLLALKKVRSTTAELQRYCSYFTAFESRPCHATSLPCIMIIVLLEHAFLFFVLTSNRPLPVTTIFVFSKPLCSTDRDSASCTTAKALFIAVKGLSTAAKTAAAQRFYSSFVGLLEAILQRCSSPAHFVWVSNCAAKPLPRASKSL